MILTNGIDVKELTEFDRLFCLMVFFQLSFYKDPITYKCPNCGVDIKYRYDMVKYIVKLEESYVDDQEIEIQNKNKLFKFKIGWPSVKTMSNLMTHFYSNMGEVTEEMERTQFGINFVMSFIREIKMDNISTGETETEINLDEMDWETRMECINLLPSLVVFDQENGLFSKITGIFINRVENCFKSEICPQCHKDTYYGLSKSSHFYSFLYGSLKSIYGFCLRVECLLIYKYGVSIYNEESNMTYNDLQTLVHQIGVTAEKENQERKKIGNEPVMKGLWYIREVLNTLVFPMDSKRN